jgi:uncharacterized membrane protein
VEIRIKREYLSEHSLNKQQQRNLNNQKNNTMTPLKLGLALIVILIMCYMVDHTSYKGEWQKIVGGVAILVFLLNLMWAIFYYL